MIPTGVLKADLLV